MTSGSDRRSSTLRETALRYGRSLVTMKSFTLLAALVLAGCATDPEDIDPLSRSYEPLLVHDCATLMEREAVTQSNLDRYTELQSNNRVTDAVETLATVF